MATRKNSELEHQAGSSSVSKHEAKTGSPSDLRKWEWVGDPSGRELLGVKIVGRATSGSSVSR